MVVIAAVGLAIAILLPVINALRQPQRSASCLGNLKELFAAAAAYANDHQGGFFYDWNSKVHPDGMTADPEGYGVWCDKERLGRYVDAEKVQTVGFRGELGDGLLVCPNEDADVSRSYGFNIWASGVQADDEMKAREARGRFFDTSVESPDQILLFGEGYARTRAEWNDKWVLRTQFGFNGSPSTRFAGTDGPLRRRQIREGRYDRVLTWEVNYALHGETRDPLKPRGVTNIGYVDGHASSHQHDALYDPATLRSRYQALWTPEDRAFDEPLEYTPTY